MPDEPPYHGRPTQPPGLTYLGFSPDGMHMITAGCGNYAKSFRTGEDGEPDMLIETAYDTYATASGNNYVILGAEDGTVTQYKMPSGYIDKLLYRSTLPIRDLALHPEEKWLAVSGDEVEVKLINRQNIEEVVTLREHPKPIKHLTFDPFGKYLACSCTNGIIYIYEMHNASAPSPTLLRTIDGVIKRLETAMCATSRCVWHPDGRTFACATAARDIQIVSLEDGAFQRVFSNGHKADIHSISWSPNGALLASASGDDDQLVIWNCKNLQIMKRFNYEKILHITWHNKGENLFCWTNANGETYINPGFLQDKEQVKLLQGPRVPAPYFHDPLDEASKPLVNGQIKRAASHDSLDEMLGPVPGEDDFDWIEDDDNAGYINGNGKRTNGHLGHLNGFDAKQARRVTWQPRVHQAFQPGSTPWRGNRKYLCLNLVGFVWTVDQDTHHTITVEFLDRDFHRDFHFTDTFRFDKACLNEHGTLFASPSRGDDPSMVSYRPHETWTNRSDWQINLPEGEDVTSIALSTKYIVATTSKNYVRVWTLYGTPVRIWRMKACPAVACASYGDFVMTVANGPVGVDGSTQLVYSIEDITRDETCQDEDILALSASCDIDSLDDDEGRSLKTVFFSDAGDPCIYDSRGVLLTLLHWRKPGQAKWVPLLDTKQLERLRDGKKIETYWPVAVAGEKFHCIILKGGDTTPYFPRPLLTEFEFRMPVNRPPANGQAEDGTESNAAASARHEEHFVRATVLATFLADSIDYDGGNATLTRRTELLTRELEVDKLLLQLVNVECREGEDRGMKTLEIVKMMKDRNGKMIEAAAKIVGRWGYTVLEEKIRDSVLPQVQSSLRNSTFLNCNKDRRHQPIVNMAFAWKAAGISYNRYLAVASRVVRRSLKEGPRLQAERRGDMDLRFAKWTNGKQGEVKNLGEANAAAAAEHAPKHARFLQHPVEVSEMADSHIVHPNLRVVDITQQFQGAVNKLSRDQLVKDDGFTLFEAVSALEIGDPKMDSGSNAFDENAENEIEVLTDITPDQLIWTIDELVRREVAWLQGYPLAQTLFTSVHLDQLLWPEPKTLADAHFDRESSLPKSTAQAEEDFATQLYNREMLRRFSPRDIVVEIEKALLGLESTSWQKELVQGARKRMTFRVGLLTLLLDNASSPPRPPQSLAEDTLRLLADIEKTASLGQELRGAFSTKIQRRLASSVPPRPMIAVDRSDALGFMHQLFQDISAAFELFSVSSPSDLTAACWTLMSRAPQPSVYVRALVQSFLDIDGQVLGAHTNKDVILDDLDALVCPPKILLDPANDRVENPYDDRFRIAWQLDAFIVKCGPSYLNQLRSFCQNRCRVRRNLCHAMLEWDSIQADAEEIDGNIQALTRERPIPYPSGATPTYSYSLSSWVYHYKLAQFRLEIQMGFELSVFAPHEHASMYWYLSHITGIHMSHLERIRHFVSYNAEEKPNVHVTLNVLYRNFSYLKAVDTLSSALHRVFLVLQRHGHFARVKSEFARDELQHELRMRPFQFVQIPELMTHADMDRFTSLRSLSDEQLLEQAARLSTASKKAWEEVLKGGWNVCPLQLPVRPSTLQPASPAPVIEREWIKDVKDTMRACIGTSIAINSLTNVQQEAHKSGNSYRVLQSLEILIPPPEDVKRFHKWWAVPSISR
ncbi:hypothetical protein DV736_g2783, partial [Chaetothyriales sp. CBS 134916]